MNQRITHSTRIQLTRNVPKRNLVVVGASAGGVEALTKLVASLPPDFAAALFVAMHIPAHVPSRLHEILAKAGNLPASQATDGEAIYTGRIYVAPTDRHLMIDGDRIRVTRSPKENRSRPSINVLFRSAAYSFGPRVIGMVLTGMLDDGVAGLWTIKDRGGMGMVQSPEEAAYPSMPQNAIDNVVIDAVLPIAEMAAKLSEWVKEAIDETDAPPISEHLETEQKIALGDNAMQAGSVELGKPSSLTCPECHGSMVQINEGNIIRFRCHTGHAYSLKTLLNEIDEAIDASLWNTIRSIEERIFLLRQMAQLAKQESESARSLEQARRAEKRVEQLRKIIMEPNDLGHDPQNAT